MRAAQPLIVGATVRRYVASGGEQNNLATIVKIAGRKALLKYQDGNDVWVVLSSPSSVAPRPTEDRATEQTAVTPREMVPVLGMRSLT
jgi:hypothetical protein